MPRKKTKTEAKVVKQPIVDESSYLAPTRPTSDSDYEDKFSGRKFIGTDGKEHTYAKKVSLIGVKFINKFNPDEYKDLSTNEKKLDNKVKKLKKVPRQREPAKKVQVRCVICRDVVEVYPWEAATVDGESNFRCSKKSCVKAR